MNPPAAFKDYFSKHASSYAQFRPAYPRALYDFIVSKVSEKKIAWDCATGNGQAAATLAGYFEKVIATDASALQIRSAQKISNVQYRVMPAEKTTLEDQSIDCITVAQAVHWFEFDRFYQEVKRVSKPGAVIALWSYGLHQISEEIDPISKYFYAEIVGPYWTKERRYVEDEYKTIPFPFKTIPVPPFSMELEWNYFDLAGYLSTWSSTQRYIQEKKLNPMDAIEEKLLFYWGDAKKTKKVSWPIYLKLGMV